MNKPTLPKGTRDFSPQIMVQRNYLFNTIRKHFERFGYMPLETPSMENLETLTGKYGDEGDQLIFKILNSGDYLSKITAEEKAAAESKKLTPKIAEKALRYDLTVPFARFVVMNQHQLTFPFKRYQIQPVWRADRPQKGRYREFYQCDVDVVGSESLLYEVELIQLLDAVLTELRIPSIIKINNRKILTAIAEKAGIKDQMMDMTIAIDKLDKIGEDGVVQELSDKGISTESIAIILNALKLSGSSTQKIDQLRNIIGNLESGKKGLEELSAIINHTNILGLHTAELELDITLARGLNYYTGAIFEVKAKGLQMGSICGGGRYDNLTGIFGLPNVSGVGISFGADRIYDVMSELNLFPQDVKSTTKALIINFGMETEAHCLFLLKHMRESGINTEFYPEYTKMKKQFKYADDKGIPFVVVAGEEEIKQGVVNLKNMNTGEQQTLSTTDLLERLK